MNEIFWIKGEPAAPLAIVLCPLGAVGLDEQLLGLKEGGIETLVSLLEWDEADWLGLAQEAASAERIGLQFLSHPIQDGQVPTDTGDFRAFVVELADRLRAGEHIGVHCRGSIGRATVTAACTLIHLGWQPAAALAAVEAARGCEIPDTLEQERWILRYEAEP